MIPQKLIDKILRDYEETKDAYKVAKRVGLSTSAVYRTLASRGVERVGLIEHRQRIRKLPSRDQVLAEYSRGDSLSQIASRYGCQIGTVAECLKKAGATMRPRGNHGKKITEDEARKMVALYQELGSQQAVASLVGSNQVRVSKAMRMMGVHRGRLRREAHGSWKGGRVIVRGYVHILMEPGDPLRCTAGTNGYALEHRLVMARALGRPLSKHETVHHINGDRQDNRLSNLQLRFGRHGKGVTMVCAKCGSHEIEYKELAS